MACWNSVEILFQVPYAAAWFSSRDLKTDIRYNGAVVANDLDKPTVDIMVRTEA